MSGSSFELVILLVFISLASGNLNNMNVSVICENSGLRVHVDFGLPFKGTVYSRGFYSDPNCIYVTAVNDTEATTFHIPSANCGTEIQRVYNSFRVVNTVIFQQNPIIQTSEDSLLRLSCDSPNSGNPTLAHFHLSAMKDSINFHSTSIETWLEIKSATDSQFEEDSVIRIGDKMLAVVFVRDGGYNRGVRVKNCMAHDGYKTETNTSTFQLSDASGCSLQPDFLANFSVSKMSNDASANLVAFAHMKAFRFTDKDTLSLSCDVEVCRNECPSFCLSYLEYPAAQLKVLPKSVTKRSLAQTNGRSDVMEIKDSNSFKRDDFSTTRELMRKTMDRMSSALKNRRKPKVVPKPAFADFEKRRSLFEVYVEKNVSSNGNQNVSLYETKSALGDIFLSSTQISDFFMPSTSKPTEVTVESNDTEAFSSDSNQWLLTKADDKLYVTKTFTVLSPKKQFKHLKTIKVSNFQSFCFPRLRFTLLTGFLCTLLLCLLLTCVLLALYIRNEKKRHLIDSFLLYNHNWEL